MSAQTPWAVLGVAPDIGVADLRRRYAALIKQFRPETHPQDFARIREAYEVALPFARRSEAAQAARAAQADEGGKADAEAAPTVQQGLAQPDLSQRGLAQRDLAQRGLAPQGLGPGHELSAPSVPGTGHGHDDAAAVAGQDLSPNIVAPPLEPTPGHAEPSLADRFHAFQALAASASGSADEALLPALRVLLQARTTASLDDSQALEFALMRGFVESPRPTLTLLFESGRAFDWHTHVTRLATWLTPTALREMEARLALSRDLVYARHFTGNGELRRLHAPGGRGLSVVVRQAPSVVIRPVAVEAMAWAQRWRRLSVDADSSALAGCLDARALRRLQGTVTTDVLMGLAAAALASDGLHAFVYMIFTTGLTSGVRVAFRTYLARPGARRARALLQDVERRPLLAVFLVGLAAVGGVLLLAASEAGSASALFGWLLVAPAIASLLILSWRWLAWFEILLAWPFQWREAVNRLELDRLVRNPAIPPAGLPFGTRLSFFQRLRAIPEALRLQRREIAARERPPRPLPFNYTGIGLKGARPSGWRVLWFGLWILFAILRATHVIG